MLVNTFSMIDFIRKFHDEEACETALTEAQLAIWAALHSVRLFSCISLTYSSGFSVLVFEPSQSYGRDHHGTPQDFTHQVVSSALLSEFE